MTELILPRPRNPLRPMLVHRAILIKEDGGINALCFGFDRTIDRTRVTGTTDDTAVNCAKCLKLIARAAASIPATPIITAPTAAPCSLCKSWLRLQPGHAGICLLKQRGRKWNEGIAITGEGDTCDSFSRRSENASDGPI